MSYFSLVNLVLIFFLLPCIFFYHPWIFIINLILWLVLYFNLLSWDLFQLHNKSWKISFWLFIISEVIIFLTLMFSCFWFNNSHNITISYSFSVPLVETFLLIMSSIFVSLFHGSVVSSSSDSNIIFALLFSLVFIFFALDEFLNSPVNSLMDPYYASCFMLVGLHLSHVIIGSVGLLELLKFRSCGLVRSKVNMLVIYWHFVDFIWLFVFMVVYIFNSSVL
uniref:Cytochrome c oxidase subunit 3 n=1 Tax=Schistosoma indicum TaxID=216970 RepID=A0A6G9KAW9_9TREM|nr:cytochrome c oxidase subunit III [Schistosoma indicum]QIQ48865.1 cytochrome c oxidase subunit III [Schistosoma indicum]